MEKYVRVKPLGKGSFGAAILIRRKADNQLLVVKEVNLTKMSAKEREEARNECKVLQQLNHPNIVRYIEHYELRGVLYIIMEYADGGDLAEKIRASPGRMREDTIMYYFSQLCLALEYLHSRHILHRDIKTMNIFLMKNGAVKLGDFGISTVLRNTMGMANTVCGTPYYFSPELCRNKPYNNRSDVWAMGVVLYELATGKHPFDGNSMTQLMQRIVRNSVPSVPSNYSKEMRQLCDLCLQKDPSRRPNIKQLLAHPCVRRALEKLETDLMLATQCRIRLQDIIDFPMKNEPMRQPSRSNSPEAPRVAAAPTGSSPQQVIVNRPNNVAAIQQAKNDLDRVDAFIHQLGKPVNDYAKDAIQAFMKRKQEELAARKAKEAEALKRQEERNAELRRVMDEHHKQMLEHAKLRQQRLQQQHNQVPSHMMEPPASARQPLSQEREASPAPPAVPVKAKEQKRPSVLGVYGSPTPRRNVRHVLAANSPRVTKPVVAQKGPSASPVAQQLQFPIGKQPPAALPPHLDHALTPPARVLNPSPAAVVPIAKASNWVDRQQDRRRSEVEQKQQKRLDDDKKAVRDLDAYVVGRPVGGGSNPLQGNAGPTKKVIDPELEAWVQRQQANRKDARPSPRVHNDRDEMPAGVEARRRQPTLSPEPLAPELRRHVSQADLVLRQQDGRRAEPVRRSMGDLPVTHEVLLEELPKPRTPPSNRSSGRSGRSVPNAQLVSVQPTFSRSSSISNAEPKPLSDVDDEIRDLGPHRMMTYNNARGNLNDGRDLVRYANEHDEVDLHCEENLAVPEIIRIASSHVAEFQSDVGDFRSDESTDVPVDAYEAMLSHLQHVLEPSHPSSHAANRHKAAINDAGGMSDDVVDTEEYMLNNDDDEEEDEDEDFEDEVPLTPSQHVGRNGSNNNNLHQLDENGSESGGEMDIGDDGLPDLASTFYLRNYCGVGFKGQYAVNPSNGTALFPSRSVSKQTNYFQLRVVLERALGSAVVNKTLFLLHGDLTADTLQHIRETIATGAVQRSKRQEGPSPSEVDDFLALCCQMIYFAEG